MREANEASTAATVRTRANRTALRAELAEQSGSAGGQQMAATGTRRDPRTCRQTVMDRDRRGRPHWRPPGPGCRLEVAGVAELLGAGVFYGAAVSEAPAISGRGV